jgi:hypothetical protein
MQVGDRISEQVIFFAMISTISTYISYFPLREGHGIGAFNAYSLSDAREYANRKVGMGSIVVLLRTYNFRHAATGAVAVETGHEHDEIIACLFD